MEDAISTSDVSGFGCSFPLIQEMSVFQTGKKAERLCLSKTVYCLFC